MKFTATTGIVYFLNQLGNREGKFTARAIEQLPGYLGETNIRELRRLRQMNIVQYRLTDKKGVYELCLTEQDWNKMKKWLKEQITKELLKSFLGDLA